MYSTNSGYSVFVWNTNRVRAHAAHGYARATGKVGVCLATSGPSATNLVTGIADAKSDSTAIVAKTGNVPSHLLGKNAFQEVGVDMS